LIRLDVPVPLGENYKAYGVFGPYFGAGLGRNFTFKDTVTEQTVKEAYKGARVLEYGWQMGAGFMYPYKVGHFFGEFRYSFAMSNITKGYSLDRNRSVGLFIGYIIPLSALKIVKEVSTPDKLMVIPDAE
ncbi:MAG: outer membrane beta-barrel protein, partial [Cytophagales bacterium]